MCIKVEQLSLSDPETITREGAYCPRLYSMVQDPVTQPQSSI